MPTGGLWREDLSAFANLRQPVYGAIMRKTARWSLHRADLPLRLATEPEANGRFRYVILRSDGMAALTSSATFATEAEAKGAGGPVRGKADAFTGLMRRPC